MDKSKVPHLFIGPSCIRMFAMFTCII